jgi:hypothetical protein
MSSNRRPFTWAVAAVAWIALATVSYLHFSGYAPAWVFWTGLGVYVFGMTWFYCVTLNEDVRSYRDRGK